MTPEERRFRELVAQGYSRENAAARSGWSTRGAKPPSPLSPRRARRRPEWVTEDLVAHELAAAAPTPEPTPKPATPTPKPDPAPPADRLPTDAQRAWKRGQRPPEASQRWNTAGFEESLARRAPRRAPRPEVFRKVELPPVIPVPLPKRDTAARETPPPTVPPVEDLSWHDRGRCADVDPDLWFPDKGGSTREAKAICAGCEVRQACLEYALDNDERFGIFGGKSERERRKIATDRAAAGGGRPAPTAEDVRRLNVLGLTDAQVAERLAMSEWTARRLRISLGLPSARDQARTREERSG